MKKQDIIEKCIADYMKTADLTQDGNPVPVYWCSQVRIQPYHHLLRVFLKNKEGELCGDYNFDKDTGELFTCWGEDFYTKSKEHLKKLNAMYPDLDLR